MSSEKLQTIKSVGIDIGTTTTQLVISNLTVKNIAPGTLVPRMQITDKAIVYRGDIHYTPIKENYLIDNEKIAQLINLEYSKAGVTPKDIDTGAVIITGETAKKENAKKISHQVSGFAGDFVVATAGGNLESIIAGKGSGAAGFSKKNFNTVANIDIGGGTSNVGIFKNGKAIDCCCLNIGGRLLEIDSQTKRIQYITGPMKAILADCKLDLKVGESVGLKTLNVICERMAEVVRECLHHEKSSDLAGLLMMTPSLRLDYTIDSVMISGGVGDYVFSDMPCRDMHDVVIYGDIGPLLGQKIMEVFTANGFKLERPSETIRATVIGAGAQTVDVSGSTILVNDGVLPLKNIPVIKPFIEKLPKDEFQMKRDIKLCIANFFHRDLADGVALAIQGNSYLSFSDINALAKAIISGLKDLIEMGRPIIIVMEQDCGKVLGQTISLLSPGTDVICIDQIEVNEGDYIDIGKTMAGGSVVPVVIKTLVFETKQV